MPARTRTPAPAPLYSTHPCEECGTRHSRLICGSHHGGHRYAVKMRPEDFLGG